jgi:hypothetical protein
MTSSRSNVTWSPAQQKVTEGQPRCNPCACLSSTRSNACACWVASTSSNACACLSSNLKQRMRLSGVNLNHVCQCALHCATLCESLKELLAGTGRHQRLETSKAGEKRAAGDTAVSAVSPADTQHAKPGDSRPLFGKRRRRRRIRAQDESRGGGRCGRCGLGEPTAERRTTAQ